MTPVVSQRRRTQRHSDKRYVSQRLLVPADCNVAFELLCEPFGSGFDTVMRSPQIGTARENKLARAGLERLCKAAQLLRAPANEGSLSAHISRLLPYINFAAN